jgi:transaldolase/glucose-6-phosphate isomerase
LHASTNAREQSLLRALTGKVAIANAKLTYQRHGELVSSRRWQALASRGAQTQRLLWASTGTKNPNYRDVVYIEELVGPYRQHDTADVRRVRHGRRVRPGRM